jgi:hypothetical protein
LPEGRKEQGNAKRKAVSTERKEVMGKKGGHKGGKRKGGSY